GCDHGVEAGLLDRPHGVLAPGADTERRPRDEDRRALVLLLVEHEVAIVAPRRAQAPLEARGLDALEPVGGDDLVRVDVAAPQRHAGARDHTNGFHHISSSTGRHKSSGVANAPFTAVAAATAGDTRWVRPPRPWRPSKLRLLVLAARSPGVSLSGFIARHIEQPGSRQSWHAARNTGSRASAAAWALSRCEAGTTMARPART